MFSTLSTLALKAQTAAITAAADCPASLGNLCDEQDIDQVLTSFGPIKTVLSFVGAVVGFVLIFRAVKSLLGGRVSEVFKNGALALLAFVIAFNPDIITGLMSATKDLFEYVKGVIIG